MSTLTLLSAAARAYALVCYSDGRMPRVESDKFASFVAGQRLLNSFSPQDIQVVWANAVADMANLSAYDKAIASISSSVSGAADAELLMHAAQAAMVADGALVPQENTAIRALATALKLDPEAW